MKTLNMKEVEQVSGAGYTWGGWITSTARGAYYGARLGGPYGALAGAGAGAAVYGVTHY